MITRSGCSEVPVTSMFSDPRGVGPQIAQSEPTWRVGRWWLFARDERAGFKDELQDLFDFTGPE
jgi:hypothetical protein